MGAMKDKAIELHNMTSRELCDVLMKFCDKAAYMCRGGWPVVRMEEAEAIDAHLAAGELQMRHGSPAIGYTHPGAKRAAEAASHVAGHSATVALLRAAEEIDELDRQIKGFEIGEKLRDFAAKPTRDELLKERDELKALARNQATKIGELIGTVDQLRKKEEEWKIAGQPVTAKGLWDAIEAKNEVIREQVAESEKQSAKICELQGEINRIKSAQAALDEITTICRTRWDNERLLGD